MTASRCISDPDEWDHALRTLGGHLLQSWRWGEFKSLHGWKAERIAVGPDAPSAIAQILFKKRGPITVGYIPRGPAFREGDATSLREVLEAADRVCRRHRAIYLIVESDRHLPFKGTFKSERFVRGPEHIQPGRTVKVRLMPDNELLTQMHQKTRYSVRLAQRRGVVVESGASVSDGISHFYELLLDTAGRNEFGIHSARYYEDFLKVFGDNALLLLANVEGDWAAALIAARFGDEAIYMYGASSTEHRAHGAAFLLQFDAMRWAREAGCQWYDLWGIPTRDPESTAEDGARVAGTRGDDWRGLYKFKVGFGGETVSYPSTLERRYHPVLSFVARRSRVSRG